MKRQYAGDVSDYRKYALLRQLSGEGEVSIGVCWMLTPDDDRPDGNKTDYLQQPDKWRDLDPDLFDLMTEIVEHPDGRQFERIESSGILKNATFFDEIVPDDPAGRERYFRTAMEALADCNLIFFDPDNGLDVKSVAKGRKDSSKFLYRDEVARAYERGHSLLIYQHFPRENRERFIERISRDLKEITGAQEVVPHVSAHVVFFEVPNCQI